MKNRIREIVKYKTNGKQKEFADMMGWNPAYLGKLLAGNSIGLQPLLAILKAMPEIDARWLLLGEGSMISDASSMRKAVSRIREILDLEQFVAVMTPDELAAYNDMITTDATHKFTSEQWMRWISDTAERQMAIDAKVKKAMEESYADE